MMASLRLLLVALLALLAIATVRADESVSNGDITVNVAGQSGKITFWIPERSDKKYTITFDSLCETGNGYCLNNFASQQFTFTGPTDATYQNISAKLVVFDSTLGNNAELKAELYVFLEDGNYTVGQQTFYAAANTFKWSITVSKWVFAKTSNQLVLGLGVQHPSLQATWDAENYVLSYPGEDMVVQFANTALYDGVEAGVTVDARVKGSNTDVALTFNSASDSIFYDPQVTVQSGSASSLSSALVSFVRALLHF